MADTPVVSLPDSPIETTEALADRNSEETAIVVVTSLGHTICHIGELIIVGAIVAVMAEFSLGPDYALILPALGYTLMGLGALPVGYWSDRLGSGLLLRIYFLAMAAAGIAVAVAPDVWSLFAALTLLGLAASIYHPVGLAMISLGVRDHGRAMGINGAAGSLGVATGPALGMLAVSLGMWRIAFVVLAVLSLAALALLCVWMPASWHSTPIRHASDAPPLQQPANLEKAIGKKYLALALLMGAMMLGGFNYRCLVTALPPFLAGTHATSRDSFFIWIALIVGGVGQYVGSWFAGKHGAWRIYLSLIVLLVPSALLLSFTETRGAATAAACGLAVCLFALQPIENIILAEWTSASRRSLSYATKFAFTFGLGALGAPAVGLIWTEYDSLGPVFYLLAGSATLMGLLAFAAAWVWNLAIAHAPRRPEAGG